MSNIPGEFVILLAIGLAYALTDYRRLVIRRRKLAERNRWRAACDAEAKRIEAHRQRVESERHFEALLSDSCSCDGCHAQKAGR